MFEDGYSERKGARIAGEACGSLSANVVVISLIPTN